MPAVTDEQPEQLFVCNDCDAELEEICRLCGNCKTCCECPEGYSAMSMDEYEAGDYDEDDDAEGDDAWFDDADGL